MRNDSQDQHCTVAVSRLDYLIRTSILPSTFPSFNSALAFDVGGDVNDVMAVGRCGFPLTESLTELYAISFCGQESLPMSPDDYFRLQFYTCVNVSYL